MLKLLKILIEVTLLYKVLNFILLIIQLIIQWFKPSFSIPRYESSWLKKLSKKSPYIKRLISNVHFGVVICLVLLYFHNVTVLSELEETAFDWVLNIAKGEPPSEPTLTYAFLNVDELTYRHLDEPFYMPRESITELIDFSLSANPLLIFVDFLIDKPGGDSEADVALYDYVLNYSPGAPPLIFARSFRSSIDSSEILAEVRPSYLDSAVKENKNVYWASPSFYKDADQVVRRWQLWTPAFSEDTTRLVPSVQFSTLSLLAKLKDKNNKGEKRSEALFNRYSEEAKRLTNNYRQEVHANPLRQKIVYTLPWEGGGIPLVRNYTGSQVPLVRTHNALPILKNQGEIDNSWLQNRVVILGATYADNRDSYLTPIGEMPGSYVLFNAINSLWQYGEIRTPPLIVKIAIEVALIIFVSACFALMPGTPGAIISFFFIAALLVPVSFKLLSLGIWVDFALPLFSVQLHHMVEEFKHSFLKIYTKNL
ncbi:CHASE2 domain-containing protein [Thermodesulfobacteriota bacterium]